MTRLLRVVSLLLLLSLTMPAHAEAGLLSWLDRLSGPGPFWGVDAGIALNCKKEKGKEEEGLFRTAGDTLRLGCRNEDLENKHPTWFLNIGAAAARHNDLKYGDRPEPEHSKDIGVIRLGTSVDYTLDASLDVGVGGGFTYFVGPSFVNFARPYVQPLRVTVRPLLLRWQKGGKHKHKLENLSWLLVNVNVNVLLGTIHGADFGAPADPFRVHNDIVPEIGIGVDVATLFKLLSK